MKLLAALIVAITVASLFAAFELGGATQAANKSYAPKDELRIAISNDEKQQFIFSVKKLAAENGYKLRWQEPGLPLRDGRPTTYLVYDRPDGTEIRAADVLKANEFLILFYDP